MYPFSEIFDLSQYTKANRMEAAVETPNLLRLRFHYEATSLNSAFPVGKAKSDPVT